MENQEEKPKEIKVVLVGTVGVGKSCLINRVVKGVFDPQTPSSVGGAYFEKTYHEATGKEMKMQIWDTAGQEKFRAIAKLYYKNAKAIILVYDISEKETFVGLKEWLNDVEREAPESALLAIVANKIDLMDHQVTVKEGQEFAAAHGALFKLTSAKENKGVEELFQSICDQTLTQKPSGTSSKRVLKKNSKGSNS
jgi:small GTP-binding protein